MTWVGLDIGGAHLKLADTASVAIERPFPLWQHPDRLAEAVAELLALVPGADSVAVTMTGELADCYATKAEGVARILEAVVAAASARHVAVYLTDGSLVSPVAARDRPLAAAASNWHALARLALDYVGNQPALLIDLGSTTTDIIPLAQASVVARGITDPERLATGELIYTGLARTPVCSLVRSLPWGDRCCGVARELFATTRDVYLLLDQVPEDPKDTNTADGRPATRAAARDRLARMIGADRSLLSWEDAVRLAERVARVQQRSLTLGARRVAGTLPSEPRIVVVSGSGEWLARRVAEVALPDARIVSLSEQLGFERSCVAPAVAVCLLAARQPAVTPMEVE